MTRTRIIISSENRGALKSHPIWSQIMELFLNDGPIMVEEISDADLPAAETSPPAECS